MGTILFRGKKYDYRKCLGCKSLYLDPMPDQEVLAIMYGTDYEQHFSLEEGMSGTAGWGDVGKWFKLGKPGTFIDYGCGAGHLLREAVKQGWKAVGVEYDRRVADKYSDQAGVLIVTDPAKLGCNFKADLLHLGDVIEHLTDLDSQIYKILELLKNGGIFLAQGPLEGNPNLFLKTIQCARFIRRRRITEMPPYHVIQATANGQRSFFRRLGLSELSFKVYESPWPAPARLSTKDLTKPRALTLFSIRRLSQFTSGYRPDVWGNRYFYAGQWNG